MTKMTKNGVSTTTELGQEQYETFTSRMGSKRQKMVQYDYRHTNGVLFGCVRKTLDECRAARDKWLETQSK